MLRRSIVTAVIFGIASLICLSAGGRSPFAAGNVIVDESDRVVLHGNVHPMARPESDIGATDPSVPMKRMILLLKLTPEKLANRDRLLAEQLDSSSPNFHHWLTPEEYGKRFGRSSEEIAIVKKWLVSHGFTIDQEAKGGNWINFSGTVAEVERAFQTRIHDYHIEGHNYYANSIDPSIPHAIADLVAGPVSLNNFPYKPLYHKNPVKEKLNSAQDPAQYNDSTYGHELAPGDFAVIYNVNSVYNLGYDGTGVTIAIGGDSHPDPAKWNYFRSYFGLPYNPPSVIVNGTDPGLGKEGCTENDLDVEWSGAVAKGATIEFVCSADTNSTPGFALSAQYIVEENHAPIISPKSMALMS